MATFTSIDAIPANETIDRGDGPKVLGSHESLFVKQTKRGCVQELFGCEATNEFKIFPSKEEVCICAAYSNSA